MKDEKKHKLRTVIKLRFANEELFFGPGIAGLFREIDNCGNVREACEKCGFSYSKAWKIIRRCEEEFGYPIVNRQAGGSSGGKASVTEKGHDLLAAYDELLSELEAVAADRFSEIVKKYRLEADRADEPDNNK